MTRSVIPLLLVSLGTGCTAAGPVEMALRAPDFVIDDGDYILPRVSPDGRALAYAEVTLFQGDDFQMESTQLWILDLATGERTLLLDEESAVSYGWYAAAALDLKWTSAHEVSLRIHDGDVDGSVLVVDVRTKELISASTYQGGPISAEAEEMARRVRDEFPERAGNVNLWFMGPTSIHGDQVIFPIQERFDHPPGTWVADLKTRRLTQLLSHGDSIRFGAGAPLGEEGFLLAMYSGGDVEFLVHQSGRVTSILSVEMEEGPVEVLRVWEEGVLMKVARTRRWDQGDNPLFWYDGQTVQPIVTPSSTIDADYWTGRGSPGVLVLNVWRDGRRRLEVRRKGHSG